MEGKDDKKTKCKMVGMLPIKGNESIKRVYSADHLAPSIVTNSGGNHEIKVVLWGGIGDKKSNKGTQWYEQNRIYDANGLATALSAEMAFHPNYKTEGDNKMKKLRIRKLTEGECYRLMGFEEKDTKACEAVGQSKANIYHQAGDSIVTTVLMGIFGELLEVPDYQAKIEAYADKLAGECK